MEASPGHLEIYDAPGNVTVKTQDDITLENTGGKSKSTIAEANVEVRFSAPPKEDIEIDNASAGITLSSRSHRASRCGRLPLGRY